jgi:hypothetical protein
MRRTILVVCAGFALVAMLAPAATAAEPIPVTCTLVSIQNGWGTGNDKEVNTLYPGDADGIYDENGDYLWHLGTGYFLAHGDTYCRGRWDVDGGWWITPIPPNWLPPIEGVTEGHWFGTWHAELSHANIDGGFDITYQGELIWDRTANKVIAGTAYGVGYGELQDWVIDLEWYLPFYPPHCDDCGQDWVWTGYVTPAGD